MRFLIISLFLANLLFSKNIITKNKILSLNNPFTKQENMPILKSKPVNLDLQIIFNKRAKINGKWYKQNDFIGNFHILKISLEGVLVQSDNFNLWLKKGSKNVKIHMH